MTTTRISLAARSPDVRREVSPRVDAWVEQRMAAHATPGAAVAVVRGGGVVHLAGYGTADPDGTPVTPDTAFLVGSVSKTITAALLGHLVAEGVLGWDEPAWPHLAHLADGAPAGFEAAAVEQLLTHTAGLGMTGSFATAEAAAAAPLATGHERWFGRWRPVDHPYDDAGAAMGYIGSTARDLAAFMQAHLDGHPAIPARASQLAGGPIDAIGWDVPLEGGYGRGWFVDELAGHAIVAARRRRPVRPRPRPGQDTARRRASTGKRRPCSATWRRRSPGPPASSSWP